MAVTVDQSQVAGTPLAQSRQDLAEQLPDPLPLVVEPRGVARREVGQPALDRARLFLRREPSRDADPGSVELGQPPGHRRDHGRPVGARVIDPLPEQAAPGLFHHDEPNARKVPERLRNGEA